MTDHWKLNRHASNRTSQFGEDGILKYLIDLLDDKIVERCCEVGAGNGRRFSNTYSLWHDLVWSAVLIEQDRQAFGELEELVADRDDVNPILAMITPEGSTSLDAIFQSQGVPGSLGVLSIDIDSYDYHVWKRCSYLDPQIVVIEYNNQIPPWIDYRDPEGSVFLRCSIKALELLGQSKGYRLVACTVSNGIFLKEELCVGSDVPDMPAEALLDYEGLRKHDSDRFALVRSQLVTSFPVFTRSPDPLVRWYFRLKGWIRSTLGAKEEYARPDEAVRERLEDAGLHL